MSRRYNEELLMLPELALSDGVEPLVLQVTDIKQWAYCPRIVYFRFNWPGVRPSVYNLEEGRQSHEDFESALRRRRRKLHGLPHGEWIFNVSHYSRQLGLSGRVDLVIKREDEIIPVDFKDSPNIKARHFRLQVVAYALLLEERFELPARRGFIYSLPRRRGQEVRITSRLRNQVMKLVRTIAEAVQGEEMPPGPKSLAPCVACEFRRFCNDRL